MLEAWSRTRDGTRKLSANFTVAEFACKDGSDPVFVDSSLAALLQKIRDHFGRPVVITSGYRTAAHNRSVGGAAYSQHLYGRAADIRVQGIPVEQLAAYAETCLPGTGGIGTTIFYVVGGGLMVAAAILLITKKRMENR
jgi:LPXTG-motif cell wall-anchored protein